LSKASAGRYNSTKRQTKAEKQLPRDNIFFPAYPYNFKNIYGLS